LGRRYINKKKHVRVRISSGNWCNIMVFKETTSCATQAVWLRRILEVMHQKQNTPTEIYCDNKSAIALSKNPIFHGWSKHIDIRFHKIRELIAEEEVMIKYCPIEEQIVDIFTKPLKMESFYKLKKMLGMMKA